jgi:hypothetical protein
MFDVSRGAESRIHIHMTSVQILYALFDEFFSLFCYVVGDRTRSEPYVWSIQSGLLGCRIVYVQL